MALQYTTSFLQPGIAADSIAITRQKPDIFIGTTDAGLLSKKLHTMLYCGCVHCY